MLEGIVVLSLTGAKSWTKVRSFFILEERMLIDMKDALGSPVYAVYVGPFI